jgi:hypothetical protein
MCVQADCLGMFWIFAESMTVVADGKRFDLRGIKFQRWVIDGDLVSELI